jgi:thermitase
MSQSQRRSGKQKSQAKSWRRSAAAAAAVIALGWAGMASAQSTDGTEWAKGRLLLMPSAGLSEAALGKILAPHGGKARKVGNSELRIVDLPAGVSETAVLAQLQHNPHLKFVELDRKVKADFVPTDPYYGSEWHLPKISAGTAWNTAQGAGVTIAIVDSGVMPTHPDLQAALVPGWNIVANNSNTADVYGHGTEVAGAAAAITNNASGVAGVAGAAKIMPILVTDSTGSAYYSDIASGVTWAADHGARVANASFASLYSSSSVKSAGQYLQGKGGLLVVSAGNYGTNDGSPWTSTMIPVSATDSNDAVASWSSYGAYVAVAAPGVGIYTTDWSGSYSSHSGTSFSSPVTAGVVALIMSANPALSSGQVQKVLLSTATDLGAAGYDIYYGYGRVNAAAAVSAALSTAAADTQPPAVSIASPSAGATLSGQASVSVNASDNVGVTKVEFRVNGGLVATDTTSPYQFSWDTTTATNGSYNLTAVAYDAAGNSATSSSVSVNVSNIVATSTTPPVVTITNPTNGATIKSPTTVSASASDVLGTTGMSQWLYIDGKLVASSTGTSSVSYNFNPKKWANGTHTVTATAKDSAGNQASTSIQMSN